MSKATEARVNQGRRSGTTAAAFLIGLPLAAAVLAPVLATPGRETVVHRYLHHPVECVEVVLFCCALGTLAAKRWAARADRRANRTALIPAWDGKPIPAGRAPELLATLDRAPQALQGTWLALRTRAVLDFIGQRRSAAELDDHLRTLADADALTLEGSYSLTRFITWAMPILGFLGTVLGITGAIANITPEVLEKSLSSVTAGLALAFDATALALGLTMVTMFCTFLVERTEQEILEDVDRVIDRELAHRFERAATEQEPFLEAVRHNAEVLLGAADQLVSRQAEVWSQSVREVQRREAEAHAKLQERFAGAVESALEKTMQIHARRLVALEKHTLEQTSALLQQLASVASAVRDTGHEQQAALVRVAENVADQAAVLGQLQNGEQHLLQLQTLLQQNLQALHQAGTFDEALHSLTAAIHLLTSRAAGAASAGTMPLNAVRAQTGKAA